MVSHLIISELVQIFYYFTILEPEVDAPKKAQPQSAMLFHIYKFLARSDHMLRRD
ncbi:hypothetical protein JCM16418_2328 [Paenibacillus pini JCM 16418]|uniref:Uncharacterized protein n=1 Tax=Paenibacillus pini JCM 16418 TaxID=1236976 RepID=W7YUK8_9BACL|nr:hypothetical protein JCM16418_2328 [Paenibacillus pini JCM 16418]